MAKHPLFGANLKIKWAKEHIRNLIEAPALWGNDAYEVWAETDPNTGEIIEKGRRKFDPEMVLQSASYAIVNLRSALDHLAFAISRNEVGTSFPERDIQFPIKGSRKSFEDPQNLNKIEKMLGSRGLSFIVSAAPYPVENAPGGELGNRSLARLNELAGIEKHRRPIDIQYMYGMSYDNFGNVIASAPQAFSIGIEEADEVIELRRFAKDTYPHVNVKPAGVIVINGVNTMQGERFVTALNEIAHTVSHTMAEAAAQFFP